jgi:hypothetical protein
MQLLYPTFRRTLSGSTGRMVSLPKDLCVAAGLEDGVPVQLSAVAINGRKAILIEVSHEPVGAENSSADLANGE